MNITFCVDIYQWRNSFIVFYQLPFFCGFCFRDTSIFTVSRILLVIFRSISPVSTGRPGGRPNDHMTEEPPKKESHEMDMSTEKIWIVRLYKKYIPHDMFAQHVSIWICFFGGIKKYHSSSLIIINDHWLSFLIMNYH